MITPFQVAYKNLLHKKVRTLLSLVGVMISAWVMVSLFGFKSTGKIRALFQISFFARSVQGLLLVC